MAEIFRSTVETYNFYEDEINVFNGILRKLDENTRTIGFKRFLNKEEVIFVKGLIDAKNANYEERTKDIKK